MKLKFWKKEEEKVDDLTKGDAITKDFGGPGIPSSTDSAGAVTEEIKPRFDEFSDKPGFQAPQGEAKTYSKEDLMEAKIDALKSKIEIMDHKLDTILTRLKDVY